MTWRVKRPLLFMGFSLVTISVLSVFVVSCSLERYSSVSEGVLRVDLPRSLLAERLKIMGAPSSYTTIDCFVVDVNGPDIPAMYNDANPFASMDLGMNSTWIQRTELVASGATLLSMKVPIGRARTVRILGVTGATPITDCAAHTFLGYPDSGMLAAPPFPLVYELARTTLDIFLPQSTASIQQADPSQDMTPSILLNAPATYTIQLANTAADFSDGAPPSAGGFGLVAQPMSGPRLANRARFDLVLDINNLDVRSFRGIQIQVQAEGGSVACGGGIPAAILTPSSIGIGMWQEGSQAWLSNLAFIPAVSQSTVHTVNFSGLNFLSVRVPVTPIAATINTIYLSLRVQDVPSTGCSTINLQSVSAQLFQ